MLMLSKNSTLLPVLARKAPVFPRGHRLAGAVVFIDFDNTITTGDILDELITRFSIDEEWKAFEKAWVEGRISSQECLKAQMGKIRISPAVWDWFLASVRIDESFKEFLEFIKEEGASPVIASDSFSPIIRRVLSNYGINGLPVYANDLRLVDDRLVLSFPDWSDEAKACGDCKTMHLRRHRKETHTVVYIGDGHSDKLAAAEADVVFAKSSLARHLKKIGKPFLPYRSFLDIIQDLKEWSHEN